MKKVFFSLPGRDSRPAKSGVVRDRIKGLADGVVVFAACENAMKKRQLQRAALVAFASTVDSGVAEVVRRQEAKWAYLRPGS